ncbi:MULTISPECIES: LysR family transcriptional regulator [unclassified Paenibacillus]|uniref:LysR family transcriptional regulator n=1 Tax=unclassified Paenibacillus TaxID=185978 RepID=UPI001AE22CA0|nr:MULTISPECIES: LysR family transcriptional regulator [unclassified Paenibacillus]MBP1154454.1 DNA-binding transcriptional LysR family regulator [Paenibacillus sp. PvP091]MBP1170162.1 DNA-binding transcriptional LysR family regulator [Paenibacillus sp. PvR098]MBP2441190.1 DNA-binding transcriptional LysR family regulator [Paenibacillus sp. PvP052]
MIINIVYLETFLIVCEYGNFTEAAKQLFVPQPTVTNRITFLENEFGQELFARGKSGKRNVKLTRAGELFLPYARQIITSMKLAKQELSHSNYFTIGSSIPLSHPFIYKVIQDLSTLNEHLNVHLTFLESSNVLQALSENDVDIAFTSDLIKDGKYQSHLLGSEEFSLILPARHSLSSYSCLKNFECMKHENLIFFEPYRNNVEALSEISAKKKLFSNQIGIIKNLINHYYGVAFLPPLILNKEINNNEMVCIPLSKEIQLNNINYYLTYNSNNLVNKGILLDQKHWNFPASQEA